MADYLNADRYVMDLLRSIATIVAIVIIAFSAAQERQSHRQTCLQFAALWILKKYRLGHLDCDAVVSCLAYRRRNLDYDAGFGERTDAVTYYYD